MKLVASMIVRNEKHRYLEACLDHLATYVDAIAILDDGSTDHGLEHDPGVPVNVLGFFGQTFFAHEGQARNMLLEWTLEHEPTHILAIDADEFVADPDQLVSAIEDNPDVAAYALCIQEIWQAGETLKVRMDGGWVPHEIACLWAVPSRRVGPDWRIRDVPLACGRVPRAIEQAAARLHGASTGTNLLHFGWAREHERQERYDRYVAHDGGRYHQSRHLDSIMWEAGRVQLCEQDWPQSLEPMKERIR